MVAWLLCLGALGCQTLSLPSIDTTGNRIFDFGRPLQLVNPHDPNNGYPSTAPAFQHPPTPPKCVQSGDKKLCKGCLSGKGCLFGKKQAAEEMRGRCGELLITPNRMVAPVGGEVVILAGVCGQDDHLVTNETIEWMLSPESVGQIVEVGDDAKGQRKSFWASTSMPRSEKLGVDFARGRTSREAGVITKGTADQSDDLPIRKGQTWVSLTSPSEGVSKVTVLAPDSDVWDKRRQTATIYWIDASWDFPQPQVVSGNEPVRIDTKVLRSDNFIPAKGWIVRYRTLNPEFAKLQSSGASQPGGALVDTVDATVDDNGIAHVYLQRLDSANTGYTVPKNGTALVEIEIVRPAQTSENMPELPLARATTSVTWNAPELVLDAMGPDFATPGQSLQYFVKVSNLGGLPAENVIVTATIPPGMRIDSTSFEPSRRSDQALIWEVGYLDARRVFELTIQVTPTTQLEASVIFDLLASPDVKQQKTVPTSVRGSAMSLQFNPKSGYAQVSVGEQAVFDCVVTNTGNQVIGNLRVELESEPGLVHYESKDTMVARELQQLAPGQTVTLSPLFLVQREGDLGIRATVSSMGQVLVSQSTSVRGIGSVQPPPSTGGTNPNTPPPMNGGGTGTMPPGSGLPPNLQPPGVMPPGNGGGLNDNGGMPPLPSLPPLPGTSSSARPAIGSGVADPAAGGSHERLAVSIQPMVQFIKRGDTVAYELRVDNLAAQADQRVSIAFTVPKGCRLISVRAQGLDYRMNDSSRIVELTPIQYFRPRDSFTVTVQLKHEESDTVAITASARSRNQTDGVSNSIRVQVQ